MSRNIKDLHPRLQEKIVRLKELCKKNDLSIGIGECLRTVSEQDALYAQGRTKPGNIVTNARGSSYSSQHQWGIAFDFYRNDGTGAFNESGKFFDRVGTLAKTIELGWGGDWVSIVDKPHLYLPDWGSTTSKLKKQYGTPDKFMKTWESAKTSSTYEPTITYTRTQFIREVQAAIGAEVDGIAGSETLSKTVTISAIKNQRHSVVKPIQKYLHALGYESVGAIDGIAGWKFTVAVKSYQQNHGCVADGEITARKRTWKALLGIV